MRDLEIDVAFEETEQCFDCEMSESDTTFDVSFDESVVIEQYTNADPYDGDYEVTPRIAAQTLPTAGKLMAQDVTVREIPRYDVSNTSGGTTIFIANEV